MKVGALAKHISNLGYGNRREVMRMIAQRRVSTAAGVVLRANDAFVHDDLRIDGEPLDPPPGAVLMLHKPVGYVSSTEDANPLIYDLLPARFLRRAPVMAPVGRLDRDTSGLLLLTDDGALNHRITSPRTHVPKVYEATLASELRGDEADLFASGTMLLKGETQPLRPALLEVIDAKRVRVTVHEGRYHQVRRMFVAAGNHVVTLHRSGVAGLTLGELPAGAWRVLTAEETGTLRAELDRLRDELRERSSPRSEP